MPRSPFNHSPILVVKRNRFLANKDTYKSTGGHPGIDLWSPIGDDWFAGVNGVLHIINRTKAEWGENMRGTSYSGYGAGVAIDWGQADGSFIRLVYGHGQNRKLAKDGQHVAEGDYVAESGATGYVRPKGPAGAHLHLEMRHYPKNGTGKFNDPTLKRRYNLLDPEKEFLQKYGLAYQLA